VHPNSAAPNDSGCALRTAVPTSTENGRTYTFKIRDGVKWHDGSPLTADDVASSWNKIIDPPEGVASARQSQYMMVDKVEANSMSLKSNTRFSSPAAPHSTSIPRMLSVRMSRPACRAVMNSEPCPAHGPDNIHKIGGRQQQRERASSSKSPVGLARASMPFAAEHCFERRRSMDRTEFEAALRE